MRTRFLGDDLWPQLERLARRSPKTAAIAYVSDSTIPFGKGDVLITNASRGAIESAQTSAIALLVAHKHGATVYSLPDLHAKLMVTSGAVFIGSANLSRNSRHMWEAGVITTDADVRSTVRKYVERLKRRARGPLNTAALLALQNIPVVARPRTSHRERASRPSILEALRNDRLLLDTVAFTWYQDAQDLTRKVVEKEATRRGVPLPSGRYWNWFESPRTRGLVKATRRMCAGRPLVSWLVDFDDRDLICKFAAQDDFAAPLIDVLAFGNHVISIVSERPSKTAFDLRRDRRALAQVLTAGVRRAGMNFRRAISREVGFITAQQLCRLYELGTRTR